MKTIPLDFCIETERLELRISNVDEIDFVWDATQHPGFNDGMLWDTPETKEDLLGFVGDVAMRWQIGEGYVFTYHDKTLGQPVGRISVERQTGGWHVGFWTHPKFHGAGYASEALAGLLTFCFEELELKVVTASHAEWNIASRAVLERNGFRFKIHLEEGFEKFGEWVPMDTLSLSLKQWRSA